MGNGIVALGSLGNVYNGSGGQSTNDQESRGPRRVYIIEAQNGFTVNVDNGNGSYSQFPIVAKSLVDVQIILTDAFLKPQEEEKAAL